MSRKNVTLEQVKDYLSDNGHSIGPNTMTAKVNVTPEKAKWILDHCNKSNRRVKKSYVEKLRRDMESSNWYSDVDYIGFDKEGVLVNGQHRLKALAGAEIDYVTLKFDFDVEQHISMDTGNNRSYSDQVRISKKTGMDIMPNNYRLIVMAGLRLNDPKIQLSNSELSKVWKVVKEPLQKCDNAGIFDLGGKVCGSTVKSSLLWAYMSGVDIELLTHFAEVLRTGITKSENDIPIIRLRDELVDMKGGGRTIDVRRAQYTQQCVMNVINGSTSNRLPSNPVMHYQDLDILSVQKDE